MNGADRKGHILVISQDSELADLVHKAADGSLALEHAAGIAEGQKLSLIHI
ncbi:MAG: hypothetical protein QUT30_21135 [Acidobacteriota bacterium]|nr:hypothetical protein [Acidobacteriota bacterium]